MREDARYWITLQSIENVGTSTINKFINKFGSVHKVFFAKEEELASIPKLRRNVTQQILNSKFPNSKIEEIIDKLKENNIKIVTVKDDNYPTSLKTIRNPPPFLYYHGDSNYNKAVAIVGTRKASNLGKKYAKEFAYKLTKNDFVIVSGYAKGIDTYAHLGAIYAGGKTILVLPEGIFNFRMRKEFYGIRDNLLRQGTIISECFPTSGWTVGQAIARNRIIAGLSFAVIVVEAGEKGGAISTARSAVANGRKLFFVSPGRDRGDKVLEEMGGIRVEDPDEILELVG